MSDTPEYILKQPISRDRGTDDEDFGGYYIYTGESSDAHAFIYPDGFDELFVPLDRQALTKQLEAIIYKHGETIDAQGASDGDLDARVAEVLALFGLENKETDNG